MKNGRTIELCGESIKNLNKNKVKTELTNSGLGTQGTKQTIAEQNIKYIFINKFKKQWYFSYQRTLGTVSTINK